MYVLIAGEGRIHVGGEGRLVSAGNRVHMLPNTVHGIKSIGEEGLEYVSVAAPAFPSEEIEAFYER